MALLLGSEAPQRGTIFASTGMPSQKTTEASFFCLSSLTVSLMPPSVPQTPPEPSHILQDEHMLISISGYPSPRYFLRTQLSDFSQCKDPPSPTSSSHVATQSPSSRLSSMLAPFMTSSLSSRSHHPILSQACTKGFFSISSFSSLPWVTAEIYLSPLLLVCVLSPTGHHFQLHPCSLFPLLLVIFHPSASCPCLTCTNPWVSALPLFLHSAPLKPHFSSHPEM